MAVFYCVTTSFVNIKIKKDYSSQSLLQSFLRFSSEVGYPKKIVIDSEISWSLAAKI